MSTQESTRVGLRHHKKEQTRAALSWAAIRLAVERGLNNVRVEDIAAEVGVSTRTFNNYFSSKGEAVAARHLDRARRIGTGLRDRPSDEPLWESLIAAVLAEFGSRQDTDRSAPPDQHWISGVRLMVSEPALQRDLLAATAAGEETLAATVAERTGTDPNQDLYPRLVAGAVSTAIQTASRQWTRADPPVPITSLLEDALRQLAAGLPAPD